MNISEFSPPPNLEFKGMNMMEHFHRNRAIDFSSPFIGPHNLSQRSAHSANVLNNDLQNSQHPSVGPQQFDPAGQFRDRTSSTSSTRQTPSDNFFINELEKSRYLSPDLRGRNMMEQFQRNNRMNTFPSLGQPI